MDPLPAPVLEGLRNEDRQATLSPARDVSGEQARLLNPWRGFDLEAPDPEVVILHDSDVLNNAIRLSLEDQQIHARIGFEFLALLRGASLVVVPTFNRAETNSLGAAIMTPDDDMCFVLVVEDDQLAEYQERFQAMEQFTGRLAWIVLPPGAHRGVLVSRQLIRICFCALQAEDLVEQEYYFMVDDDILRMEDRQYRLEGDRYVPEIQELNIRDMVQHFENLLQSDITVQDHPDDRFHQVWVAIGSTPSRNLKGKSQYRNMAQYDLSHSSRVAGVMCIHIERSIDLPFCPIEWLWYTNEKWNQIQLDREHDRAIQLIYFQGEDFRFCAMAAEEEAETQRRRAARVLLRTYCNNKLVIHYMGLASQARTINPTKKEQTQLVDEYWNRHVHDE